MLWVFVKLKAWGIWLELGEMACESTKIQMDITHMVLSILHTIQPNFSSRIFTDDSDDTDSTSDECEKICAIWTIRKTRDSDGLADGNGNIRVMMLAMLRLWHLMMRTK